MLSQLPDYKEYLETSEGASLFGTEEIYPEVSVSKLHPNSTARTSQKASISSMSRRSVSITTMSQN
jgi:hypothetical protein